MLAFTGLSQLASAAEVCGDMWDNDNNGLTDEGCYPSMTTGVCASPISCSDTGWVSWGNGSLHYDVPADVAPKSPYGIDIGLRRFYTGMYAPGTIPASVNRKPLGERWQHNYMSWLERHAAEQATQQDVVVVHANGQDIMFHDTRDDDQDCGDPVAHPIEHYSPQAGHHYKHLCYHPSSGQYTLGTLTGEQFVYNSSGQLVEIHDTVVAPNTNKVLITWTSTSNGNVGTVTDATGARRLDFSYSGSLLTTVDFQLLVSGTWTTRHRTTYGYVSGALTTVTIGGQLAQTNVYSGGALTQIKDGEGKELVSFKYASAVPGQVCLVDTNHGTVGFEYNSSRAGCLNQTVLYFNKGNPTSCSADADCGAGYLCGGKTGSGATGTCFRGAHCLTLDSSSGESLVTGVSALGPPGEPCTGACAEVTQYVWNTTGGRLDLTATKDALGGFTTASYNSYGLPTKITYADNDANPSTGGAGSRTVYLFYDGIFPGRLIETRHDSVMAAPGTCTGTLADHSGCTYTTYQYDNDTGQLSHVTQNGWTLNDEGDMTSFTYTIVGTYDALGRLQSVDGPAAGSGDRRSYSYKTSSDPTNHGFLDTYLPHFQPLLFLQQSVLQYDFWGNAIEWSDYDGTTSCRSYDAARNYLTKMSEEMTSSPSCASDAVTDIIERYTRDSALRLTKATRGDGSCMHYEYDSKGRLIGTKRRDDCNPASSGDREEYVYNDDGQVTETNTYDAAGTVKHKALTTYYDSGRLEAIKNPADVSKLEAFTYDERGVVTEVNSAGLGQTTFTVNADYRVTSVTRSKTATTSDTWTLVRNWLGNLIAMTDPDSKVLLPVYDDLGRRIRLGSPDHTQQNRSYTESRRVRKAFDSTQAQEFTYDSLGRLVNANYAGQCPETTAPEVENSYDFSFFCPIPSGCNNLQGRPVWRRVTLMCDSTLSGKALNQWTFYSYDAAGRLETEYTYDNGERKQEEGKAVTQRYVWTKGHQLSQATMPSSAVLGTTYGSAGSNSDTDRPTALWRSSAVTPVIDTIVWNPYGPLDRYNRQDTISGTPLRTRMSYDLAYRPMQVSVETQDGTTVVNRLILGRDGKGRVTKRDYAPSDPSLPGLFDSYFLYDQQDRVLCETTTPVSSCPTSGSTIKNSHPEAYTGASDRKTLLHPIAGSVGGLTHQYTLAPGTHRIAGIRQIDGAPALLSTVYLYNERGNRQSDNSAAGHDERVFTYDGRNNVVQVQSSVYNPVNNTSTPYTVTSHFDAQNRRVLKIYKRNNVEARWYFYYDAYGRLSEVRYTPDITVAGTFTTYQLFWLDELLVAYWQTDAPAGTTTKYYAHHNEDGRPVGLRTWSTGNSTLAWAINPDAWGFDKTIVGPQVYQPLVFAGQYLDQETAAYLDDGVTVHRPGLVLNGARTYDPFTGSYLQLDPLVESTWSPYAYANHDPVNKNDPSGLKPMSEWHCESAGGGSATSTYGNGETIAIRDPVNCYWVLTGESFDGGSLIGVGNASGGGNRGSGAGGKSIGGRDRADRADRSNPPGKRGNTSDRPTVCLDQPKCCEDIVWLLESAHFYRRYPVAAINLLVGFTGSWLGGNLRRTDEPCYSARALRQIVEGEEKFFLLKRFGREPKLPIPLPPDL
jgi:RHS repeat-associated protein